MSAETTSGDESWTVRRILDWTIDYLKKHGSDNPRLEAEVLLAHARACRRIQLYTQFDEPLTAQQRNIMRDLVKRRAAAEPVAYLVGHKEFFSLDFEVGPGVLIPRPETEVLVASALDVAKELPQPRVLDLCTGSGCVAIAIAKNCPQASVLATEREETPLATARRNIARHKLESRVEPVAGDLYGAVPAAGSYHVIVSNPPYVRSDEIAGLAADIRDHEPHSALDGGPDGLDTVRRIIDDAPRFLLSGGWLMIEISPEQAEQGRGLLADRGFVDVATKNDLAGRPRVIVGRRPD